MTLFIPRKILPSFRPTDTRSRYPRHPAKTAGNRHKPQKTAMNFPFRKRRERQGHPKSGSDRTNRYPLFPKKRLSKRSGKTAGQPRCRGRENTRFRANAQNGFPKTCCRFITLNRFSAETVMKNRLQEPSEAVARTSKPYFFPGQTTTFWRCSPSFSTPATTTSPGFRKTCGSRASPTPGGVPVAMTSPGKSVMKCER